MPLTPNFAGSDLFLGEALPQLNGFRLVRETTHGLGMTSSAV